MDLIFRYSVYAHINNINDKIYIGITSRKPNQRWRQDGKGYKTQKRFYRAIIKYGWDNFQHIIIASNLTEQEAKNFEVLLINKLESTDQTKGYNLTLGGDGARGYALSEERKRKLSQINKGNKYCLGRKLSPETKQKIRESHRGKKLSIEHREKLKGRSGKLNPMFGKIRLDLTKRNIENKGKKLSEEHKRKVILACTGRKHSENTKKKMSESQKGRTFSENSINKMRQSHTGKTMSKEAREKCSLNHIGEKNRFATISEHTVIQIKKLLLQGEKNIDIARNLSISKQIVSQIKNGRTWTHVIV